VAGLNLLKTPSCSASHIWPCLVWPFVFTHRWPASQLQVAAAALVMPWGSMLPGWWSIYPSCGVAPTLGRLQADFGLSKTLPINKHAEYGYLDSKFRLTGETGAPAGPAVQCVVAGASMSLCLHRLEPHIPCPAWKPHVGPASLHPPVGNDLLS